MFKMREVTYRIYKTCYRIYKFCFAKRFSLVYLEYFVYLCQRKVQYSLKRFVWQLTT